MTRPTEENHWKAAGWFCKICQRSQGEARSSMNFKVNAMKWKVDEKNEEIKKLEQALGILELNRKSLK